MSNLRILSVPNVGVSIASDTQLIGTFYGTKAQHNAELMLSLLSLNWTKDIHIDEHIPIMPEPKDEGDEDAQPTDEQPEYYRTGIKIKNGKEMYKCYYVCPNCRKNGKHYIPKTLTAVTCHHCGFDMKVYPATHEGFPHRDNFGNYFVANTLG